MRKLFYKILDNDEIKNYNLLSINNINNIIF